MLPLAVSQFSGGSLTGIIMLSFKALFGFAVILNMGHLAISKSYFEDGEEDHSEEAVERSGHGHGHSHGHAHSFHHFSGPVKGHHEEVWWTDKHGHHHHDYKAHPSYKFAYGVEDSHTKDHHGQWEHRDGKHVEGEYHLHEPGGNFRSVKYHADHHGGFFAEVHNYGGNDHSGWHKHR